MEFKQELIEFKNHLADTTNEVLDTLDTSDGSASLEKFDIVVTVNGKSIQIPCNADAYSTLEMMIDEELKEQAASD
jgi:hypothetical protein